MKKDWKWWGLRYVVKVDRWTHRNGPREELSHEAHFYLCSKEGIPDQIADWIRGHWAVENQCHWVLDVTYNEDHCQVRDHNAAHNLSILREITATAVKSYTIKLSIRAKRKRAALDPAFRSELLVQILKVFHA